MGAALEPTRASSPCAGLAYNGVPNIAISNRDELFAELHVYF